MRSLTWSVLGLLLLSTTSVWAESVEIVTYYPSPSTTTDDLRVKRATVGSGYKALNLDDKLAPIADGTLLVESGLGLGASVPFKTAPDPSGQSPKNGLLGNLDVNDIWLRSTQSWASQALAADLAPPKPFTFALELPAGVVDFNGGYRGGVAAFNIYAALQLWKSGVQPAQLKITGAKMIAWNGEYGGATSFWGSCYWNPQECGFNNNPPSWPADYPTIRNGWVWTKATQKGTGVMEVTVDW